MNIQTTSTMTELKIILYSINLHQVHGHCWVHRWDYGCFCLFVMPWTREASGWYGEGPCRKSRWVPGHVTLRSQLSHPGHSRCLQNLLARTGVFYPHCLWIVSCAWRGRTLVAGDTLPVLRYCVQTELRECFSVTRLPLKQELVLSLRFWDLGDSL
jgi:hypothetical protein